MRALLTMLGIIIGKAETLENGIVFGEDSSMKTAGEEDYFTKEMLGNYCEGYADSITGISATENLGNGQIVDGSLYANVSAQALGNPVSPSVGSIILSLTFSMAIGVFFGYYPANKAAKMDPIEALRYE